MSFVELSHTADIRIRVTAPKKNSLFADALLALMLTVFGKDRNGCVTRELSMEAESDESLLLDFLSEVLFICEVESLVFSHATIALDGHRLHATLTGEPFDPARHAGGTEVKGISWSGLAITHDTNGYQAEILFDV